MMENMICKLNNIISKAVIFHNESCLLFNFLSLNGFSKLHEFQAITEGITQRRIKEFASSRYEIAIVDESMDNNLIKQLIKGQKRNDIKQEERKSIIRESWIQYMEWEQFALGEYEKLAQEMSKLGDVVAERFIGKICDEVFDELEGVKYRLDAYIGMDFDTAQLQAEQDVLFGEYERKLKEWF